MDGLLPTRSSGGRDTHAMVMHGVERRLRFNRRVSMAGALRRRGDRMRGAELHRGSRHPLQRQGRGKEQCDDRTRPGMHGLSVLDRPSVRLCTERRKSHLDPLAGIQQPASIPARHRFDQVNVVGQSAYSSIAEAVPTLCRQAVCLGDEVCASLSVMTVCQRT